MMKVFDTKAGKRVRGSMVDLLNQAIDNLRAVIEWAKYENDVDAHDEAIEGVKATPVPLRATIGDIERSRQQLTPRRSSTGAGAGAGGTPNWSARVGEIIIGNLMRGEGGRFASARNIGRMMRSLDDAGITPNMFTSMQKLLEGTAAKISGEVMGQLRAAGLVNDNGVVQAKANDIINAIKTGDPDNLKNVLKPPKTSGGSGGRASTAKTPEDKAEEQAANVANLLGDMAARTRLTEQLINDLVAFFDGKDIANASIDALVSMGLLARDSDANLFMTTYGKAIVTNLRAGDLRDALDAYSRGINSVAVDDDDTDAGESERVDSGAKIRENIATVSKAFIERESLTQEQIDTLFAFDSGELIDTIELADLLALGLVNVGPDGEPFMTTRGQQLVTRFETGNIRDALDALSRSKSDERTRRNNAKATRAANAETLIAEGVITRDQADALIRKWIGASGTIDSAIVDELNARGLMSGDTLSAYGVFVMRALDNNDIDLATAYIDELTEDNKAFYGMKRLGDRYFLTWTTNAFRDREGEFFTTDAIQDYLDKVDEKKYGESKYDFWHIEGSEFATIKWQGGVGRFLVEIGEFDDTPLGIGFKRFFDMYPNGHPTLAPHGWGCSHEYAYRSADRKDGIYRKLEKRKSTVLPLHEAANPFTLSEFGLGEKAMQLSAKQKNALEVIAGEIGDPNLVSDIERVGEERTRILEKSGFEFKALRVCKTEDGVCYPASDFAYVPDPESPSMWKLRLAEEEPGNITVAQLGRAAAAFSEGGFRGNRVELPEDAIEPVKRRIRSQYRKLDVANEDIPESIKMAKDETMNRESLVLEMKEMSDVIPDETKAAWDLATEQMNDPVADVDALKRLLMELLVELPDDVRERAEELVLALAELSMPVVEDIVDVVDVVDVVDETEDAIEDVIVEEDEIVVDEVVTEDELVVGSNGETKAISEEEVEFLVSSLHLDELSKLLEHQSAALKGIVDAIDELTSKFVTLSERVGAIEGAVKEFDDLAEEVEKAKEEVSGVKEQTGVLFSEKQRWAPFWANGISNGSVARETELSPTEEKAYRAPQIPNVISGIRNRMLNNG